MAGRDSIAWDRGANDKIFPAWGFVYVSFTDADTEIVSALGDALAYRGIPVTIGRNADVSQNSERDDAGTVLVVWTARSITDPEVRDDAEEAGSRRMDVLLDSSVSPPWRLPSAPSVDLNGWNGEQEDSRLDDLADVLREMNADTASRVPPPGGAGGDGALAAPASGGDGGAGRLVPPDGPQDGAAPSAGMLLSGTTRRMFERSALLVIGAQEPGTTAVLAAALEDAGAHGRTAGALFGILARRRGLSVDDLKNHLFRDALILLPTLGSAEEVLAANPALSVLADRAARVAEQTGAGREVHARHLLAAVALADNPPVSPQVLAELGTSAAELPGLVLEAIRTALPGEPMQVWERLLAVRLAGGFDRDLVDPNSPISRDSDVLEHGVWAAMFASVIAAQDTPMPVSIGLFGEWGAGKSTFMGLLRGEIEALCGQPGYVRDVVQIGFNAWHYADANLWASLGDEIFRALAQALTPPQEAPPTVKEQAARLRDEIAGGLVAAKELKAQAEHARQQSRRLTAEIRDARETQQVTARQLASAALKAPELRQQLGRAWRRLGIEDQVTQGEMLADQLDGIRQDSRALRAILSQRLTWVLAAACLAALLVTLAGTVIPVSWAARLRDSGAIGTATLVLGSALTLARRVGTGLSALRVAAAKAAADAGAESDRAIKAARDRLRHAEAREHAAESELRQVSANIEELRRELASLAPGQRLYAFLAERAASADYAGRLGLVSTIRKDFQHLVRVLDEQRKATQADPDADLAAQPRPRRVDRIVLYIDDLDRCRPRQVVEVLQAVHLLLALDLFVVVVGVDPRWLVQSLRDQYPGILAGDPDRPGHSGGDLAEAVPADYLQKIFNIPFALPTFRGDQFDQLVRRLAGETGDGKPDRVPVQGTAIARQGPDGEPIVTAMDDTGHAAAISVEPGSQVAAIQTAAADGASRDSIRPHRLTEEELRFLGALGPFVRTPRDGKRLFNVYRMLRSTRDLSPASAFLGGEYQAVAMLLALLTLDAHVLAACLDAPPRPASDAGGGAAGGLAHRAAESTWAEFAGDLAPRAAEQEAAAEPGVAWRNGVAGEISAADLAAWQRVADAAGQTSALVTLPDLAAFKAWAPHVRRFSYLMLAPGHGSGSRPSGERPEGHGAR